VIGRAPQKRRKYGWLPDTITAAERPGQGALTDLYKSPKTS
jgi:hypothetical protein